VEKSLYSSNWYRVEHTKPRLRGHARLHRHYFRGELWYVLQDPTSGRFLRFTPGAYLVINLMDGHRTAQEIWDLACERLGEDVLTQDEFVSLLGQLHQSDLLRADGLPDTGEISERGRRDARRRRLMSFINPLAVRIPLFDPDKFLSATLPAVRWVFSWPGALAFIAVVGTALVLAAENWSSLTANIVDRVLAAKSLFLLLFTYPFVKALHELGHGYALKRFGGEVHEMGVMFLVFLPVPYVDASDTAALRDPWRRAFVGAAGILVEALLAALALFAWLNAEEGLIKALAFNVMVIGGVSTLLFNGNPLLRFDGYYVLSDIVEIPNLGQRSSRYLGYLIQRHLFGVAHLEPPVLGRGEAGWLVGYALLSFCYRVVVMTAIITLVARKFFVIGVVLALWAAALMLLWPVAKQVHFLLTSPVLRRNRTRALAVTTGTIAAVVAALLLLPLPYSTVTEGVVWTPDEATVHAGVAGIVTEVIAEPSAYVSEGEPLIRLEDDLLAARVKILTAEVAELRLRYSARDTVDPAEARIVQERLQQVEADLELALQRQRDLVVRSPVEGRFVVPRAADLPGSFVGQGQTLSWISRPEDSVVRIVVPESDADLVRNRVESVELMFPNRIGESIGATIKREVPTLSDTLPSLALSTIGGGEIVVDPTDPRQIRTLSNLLHIELLPDSTENLPPLGSRVYVRFAHGYEPVAFRLYRSARQTFLRLFSV